MIVAKTLPSAKTQMKSARPRGNGISVCCERALSFVQPWAGLVAAGVKPIENRSWQADYRGIIAIHASTKYFPKIIAELQRRGVPVPDKARENWPTGAIVGVVDLADCIFFNGKSDEQAIIDAAKAAGIIPKKPTKDQVHNVLFWLNVGCYAWIFRTR